jgi:hypothetical protein
MKQHGLACSNVVRKFSSSNDSLKDALNKINKEQQEQQRTADGTDAKGQDATANSTQETESTDSQANGKLNQESFTERIGDIRSWLRTNFALAWDEMTGKAKPSSLERKVHQADSFRVVNKTSSGEEADE